MRFNYLIILILLAICSLSLVPAQERGQGLLPAHPGFQIADQTVAQSLDAESDTLRADDGTPYYVFRYPDVYGDDFRNQLYEMPSDAMIIGIMFGFVTAGQQEYSTGDPDLITVIWESSGDSLWLPQTEILRDTTAFADFGNRIYDLNDEWTGGFDQFVIVDLRGYELSFSAFDVFHTGYSAILNSPDDSLAIMSDDATSSLESSEWYNGEFHYMHDAWGGVNFLIRVIIETSEGIELLSGSGMTNEHQLLQAYPNPFNSQTMLDVHLTEPGYLSLTVYDIIGRHVGTLFDGTATSASLSIPVNAEHWASGTYFIQMKTKLATSVHRIVLEK